MTRKPRREKDSTHPVNSRITAPLLFATNVPANVDVEKLQETFKDLGVTHINIAQNGDKGNGCYTARVGFSSTAHAEKALAIMHLRPVHGVVPLVLLTLSSDAQLPFDSLISGPPRVVKLLPSSCTEAELYDLIRPFGPIACARVTKYIGGNIQFWTEEDALAAEVNVEKAFASNSKITLKAYDPCKLFCSSLKPDIDTNNLKELFKEFGTIISANVVASRQGKNRSFGFVEYATSLQAYSALKAMNEISTQIKLMSVRFHEPKNSSGTPAPAASPQNPEHVERDDKTQTGKPNHDDAKPHVTDEKKTKTQTSPSVTVDVIVDLEKRLSESKQETATLLLEIASMRIDVQTLQKTISTKDMIVSELRDALTRATSEMEKSTLGHNTEREKWERMFEIADSRRKILEMELDHPLLKEAKKRKDREEADIARMKAVLEASERKMHEFMAKEAEKERAEKAQKEQEAREEEERQAAERARIAREEAARKEENDRKEVEIAKEKLRLTRWQAATEREQYRCRKRDFDLWGSGWSNERALERFKLLLDEFDKAKFSEAKPLSSWIVPWPMLEYPSALPKIVLEWKQVENFLAYVKKQLPTKDYNALIEKAHRLFHPDKWRSRRILDTVMDTEVRSLIDKAGNIVSQALTPLWRVSKGYD